MSNKVIDITTVMYMLETWSAKPNSSQSTEVNFLLDFKTTVKCLNYLEKLVINYSACDMNI